MNTCKECRGVTPDDFCSLMCGHDYYKERAEKAERERDAATERLSRAVHWHDEIVADRNTRLEERDEARATAYNLREILDDVLQGTIEKEMVEVGGLPWEPEDWRAVDLGESRSRVSEPSRFEGWPPFDKPPGLFSSVPLTPGPLSKPAAPEPPSAEDVARGARIPCLDEWAYGYGIGIEGSHPPDAEFKDAIAGYRVGAYLRAVCKGVGS